MPKILLGISILLMAATAFFGFSNKSKISDISQKAKQANEALQEATSAKSVAEADKKKAEDAAAKAKQDAETITADLKKAQDEAQSAKTALATANADVVRLKDQVDKAAAAPVQAAPVEDTTAATKVKDLETKLAEADAKAKEAETLVTTLTNKVQETQKTTESLVAEKELRDRKLMQKGLEGQVMAVNQAWNFVVLNIGDRQGVVPTANMVVMRGGEMVAKVKISSVEPGSSVADIIPGSTAKGTRVLPGDKVIFPGS